MDDFDLFDGWPLLPATAPGGARWRPARSDDRARLLTLVDELGVADRRRRFHGAVNALDAARLPVGPAAAGRDRLTYLATAWVDGAEQAVAELSCGVEPSGCAAEWAMAVHPHWRRRGLALRGLAVLREALAARGVGRWRASVQQDNLAMTALLQRCGFTCTTRAAEPGTAVYVQRLVPAGAWLPADPGPRGPWMRAWQAVSHWLGPGPPAGPPTPPCRSLEPPESPCSR